MHTNDAYEAHIRALVVTELATKVKTLKTIENPAFMRAGGDIEAQIGAQYVPNLANDFGK